MPQQEIGGWCYEKAYLSFRYPPPEGLSGEGLDTFLNETMKELESGLEEALNPDPYEHICYAYAVELFVAYQRFAKERFLYQGGYDEQPSFQMYVLECILSAQERAEREIRAAEARMRAKAQEDAEQQAQGHENDE